MPAHDSLQTIHEPQATSATALPEGGAKENVFNQVFGFLGNHHELDFMPLGKVPLPYIFFDQGTLHVYGNPEALKESGVYTVNTDERLDTLKVIEASPTAEKGRAARLDKKPIGLDLSITSNLFFLSL